jgi:hypothetical protein
LPVVAASKVTEMTAFSLQEKRHVVKAAAQNFLSAAEAAAAYATAGFAPVPVPHGEKRPVLDGWQKLRITPAEAPIYFNGRPQNIGLILGVGGLVDVDLDAPEAGAAARELLPATPFRYGRQSKPASHAMYVCSPVPATRQYKCPLTGASLCELRGLSRRGETGAQSVVPPSTHPSGEPVRFEPGCRPEPARVAGGELERAVARVAAAALLARHWPGEGSRNQAFLALAGVLARNGWLEGEAAQFARAIYRCVWGGAADLHQAEAEVRATYIKAPGAEITGLPTLAELINERVLRTALRWLNIDAGATPRAARVIQPTSEGKQEVVVAVDALAEIAEQCERILAEAEDSDIYQAGGRLVFPVREPAPGGGATYGLATLDADGILLRLHERFRFVRLKLVKERMERVPCDVPAALPRLMLARRGRWQYRRLRGVCAVPLLRPDGMTLACREGYDPESEALLIGLPELPPIPERPTRDDAEAAVGRLSALFGEFPFPTPLDAAAAVAAAMTAVLKPSLGTTPMFLMTSPTPGSGKSYLQAVLGALALGFRPAMLGASGLNLEELDKRVVATLLAGAPLLVLDNLTGTLTSDVLCQAISAETPLKLRPLGQSVEITVSPQAMILSNGNNVRASGDLLRRVIHCRLDAGMERPELRQFARAPLEEVIENRGDYIAAVITIVRAWHAAGRLDRLPAMAGFGRWSDWVRSSLFWLSGVDVCDSIERLREEDGQLQGLRAVLAAWFDAFGSKPVTVRELAREAEQENRNGLREALLSVAGRRGELDNLRLGKWLPAYQDQPTGGLALRTAGMDSHTKTMRWRVEPCQSK